MLKQKNAYGCGMYAVANALNLHNFANDDRLELSKGGNTNGQLSKWLNNDGHNISIDALFYDHTGDKLPEKYFSYSVSECEALPLLFNVRYCENGKNHMVGAKLMNTGDLILYDSLKSSEVITKISELNNIFHNVYGMFLFMDSDNGNYIFLHQNPELI